ncbi:MAG: hypothetical protein E5W59_23565 [Mesorhizobium sp.]|nr:MAG: hypothetical protein E5W59_23565 [Mesorhizobium sp.]
MKYPFVMRGYRQPFDEEYFPALRYHATINNMEAMLVMLLSGGYVGSCLSTTQGIGWNEAN